MAIRIVRLGQPRSAGEGLRIGAVRHPPRGVPKAALAERDYYDVWLPNLAPSEALFKLARAAQTDGAWRNFLRRYNAELKAPEQAHLLDLLAALSHRSAFALGCYCADEAHCHRSVLRQVLTARGAAMEG